MTRIFFRLLICNALLAASLTLISSALAQFPPPPGTGPGLAETIEAIDSARVTTRILYITAHPDDESAAVLTYLSRGLHADVALLSLTHGEGGQNVLGPEQAPQLGLIRTQELLAATRGYGVKLYFTRAKDFGFSKTPEESERLWGDQVLEDMVRVIRRFRPNVVINNFGGVHSGHGHHQAAGLLTPKAVQLAADPSYKLPTDELSQLTSPQSSADLFAGNPDAPWGLAGQPVAVLDLERGSDKPSGYIFPLEDVSPLWGKTWREIGIDAFANHRSQGISGFLGSPFLRRPIAVLPENGQKFDPQMLAQPLHALAGDSSGESCAPHAAFCPLLKVAEENLAKARDESLALHWKAAAASVAAAAQDIKSLYPGGNHAVHWLANDPRLVELSLVQRRVEKALAFIAGVQIVGEADKSEIVAGESFTVTTSPRCRIEALCELAPPRLVLAPSLKQSKTESASPSGTLFTVQANSPPEPLSPWNQQQPEGPPLVIAEDDVTVAGYSFIARQPVTRIASSSTRVDRVPLRFVPAYTLLVEPAQSIQLLSTRKKPFEVLLSVHSYATQPANVSAGLDAPAGWATTPAVSLPFSGAGDRYAKFTVTPPDHLRAGNYSLRAYATRDKERFDASLLPLASMPTLLWSQPAECRVYAFEASIPAGLRVGYISAEHEPIPQALERLGIKVEMLDAAAVTFSDLARFNAIVLGIRAYELRTELPGANQRLLDYVSNGGTLVVQYQRDFAWDKFQFAPYPAKIDPGKSGSPLPRVTDENSPVKFLKPEDPLLNFPNRIAPDDFKGWTQERGLYFWSQFDPKYTPLLAMNDPGEPDQNGALVYTRYGKGVYIYTALAFFREIPEGVPGAYRLFVNLLSASRARQ